MVPVPDVVNVAPVPTVIVAAVLVPVVIALNAGEPAEPFDAAVMTPSAATVMLAFV
jgi:hypothetical protein